MIVEAIVTKLHWDEKDTAIQEATLEVKFENGDIQMFVIPILRMTRRIKVADSNSHGIRGARASLIKDEPYFGEY